MFHVLIKQDKILRSITAQHIRWLKKNLATIEIYLPSVTKHKNEKKENEVEKELPKQAFIIQPTWPTGYDIMTTVDKLSDKYGYHALLPNASQHYAYYVHDIIKPEYFVFVFRNIILHFANYLYPHLLPNSSSSCSSESHVHRMNYWLSTR